MADLKRTPLYENHTKLNAKMVDFGGWEMPVQYDGIVVEHKAVRDKAGIFDVSHMGEFEVKGKDALPFLERVTVNAPRKLGIGRGHYSLFLNENGGAVDDIIIYRTGKESYIIVVNASNMEKDWDHISQHKDEFQNMELLNQSDQYGLIALQGPSAEKVLAKHIDRDLEEIGLFRIRQASLDGAKVRIARTGYTGEGKNGFEIFTSAEDVPKVWESLLQETDEVSPCGLGARDTLRIEASLPLYGHELDDNTSPIEAGLDFFVSDRVDYIGASVIKQQRQTGPAKKLVMLEMIDRGIPRQGYDLATEEGQVIGSVTSGTIAPWIDKSIAMGYVKPDFTEIGTELLVKIRNRSLQAKVVQRPFFKR
jgi:aminomethyltransferase